MPFAPGTPDTPNGFAPAWSVVAARRNRAAPVWAPATLPNSITREKPSLLADAVVVSSTALTKPALFNPLTRLFFWPAVYNPPSTNADGVVNVVGRPPTV